MNNQNEKNFKIIECENGIKFNIKVIPNSSKCEIVSTLDNILKIKLNTPPIEGKANEQCIKFLSKLLNIPKTTIEIINGKKSKNKTILVKGNVQELVIKINNISAHL